MFNQPVIRVSPRKTGLEKRIDASGSAYGADYAGSNMDRPLYDMESAGRPVSFVDTVLKRKFSILGAAVIGGFLAFALTVPQTRVYRAHVSLEFAGLNDNVLNTRDVDPSATADNSSQAYINTQARVLESLPLLRRVVDKVKTGATPARKPLDPARKQKALKALTAEGLAAQLQIRPAEGTKLVDLYVESPDPDLAADLANTMADEYTFESIESKLNSSQATSGWLGTQLEDVKAKLEKSEAALQDYARRSNIIFTGADTGSVAEARLRQVQDDYSRAQADRVAKQAVYEGLLEEKPEGEAASLKDPALQEYQMKLSDLNRQLADLSVVYKPGNEKVQRVQSQIEQLKQDYSRQHDAARARVRNDFQTAQRREAMLAHTYSGQQGLVTQEAAKAVEYNILKREAETNRSIYEAMLQKVKSYGIASALQPSNVHTVDPAERPRAASKPNVPMTTFFGILGGFSLALVWVGVRQRDHVTVEYPGQTRQILNIPELGVMPSARLDPSLPNKNWNRPQIATPVRMGFETAAWHYKSSLLAESVRSIRTSMLYGHPGTAPQAVVVTSLSPAHGKTSLVSNMGIAMAEVGRRVLMIDADLRRPTLHKAFGLDNDTGLTTALTPEQPLREPDSTSWIRPTAIPGLSLLASGPYDANTSSSALFHSERMSDLLNFLRASYDAILVDTAPLTIADARILGPLCDGVILVLRAGEVRIDSVSAAEEQLAQDGSRVLGTVLNNWDPRSNGYGSYPDRYHEYGYFRAQTGSPKNEPVH